MTYAPEMQVKQFVAEVQGRFSRFQVFITGSSKHYLFCQLDPSGRFATGLQFPVLKSELRRDVRSALTNGWGHA